MVAGCGWLVEAVVVAAADFVPIVRALDVDVGGGLTCDGGDKEDGGPGDGGFEAAL